MGRFTSTLQGKTAQWAITACCGASFLLFGYGEQLVATKQHMRQWS